MKLTRKHWMVLGAALLCLAADRASALVVEFTDCDEWLDAVESLTTITFTELPPYTFITDQYAEWGVLFTDGWDQIVPCEEGIRPNDGACLFGLASTSLQFTAPRWWIAVDFPGAVQIDLFRQGKLIASGQFGIGGGGNFGGLISTEPFDAAVLSDPDQYLFLDDLHFGPRPCPPDVDGDARVGCGDFLALLAAWGTDPGGPPDLDGDGVVGVTDFLELLAEWGPCPFFVDCNANGLWDLRDLGDGTSLDCNANAAPDECDATDGTSADCDGDLVPDECEPDCNHNGVADDCDIAGGTSEDLDGNGIPDECEFTNDDCADAIVIGDGATPFSTVGATTDGYTTWCTGGQGTAFVQDVWFLYTATCTGLATFSVCNDADFDTRVAVYAPTCPTSLQPMACSDNAPGCGETSEVQLGVAEGVTYLIRVGGTAGDGTGVLTVSCAPLP